MEGRGDQWARWLLERRHGGDERQFEELKPGFAEFQQRVIANAELHEGDVVLDVGTGDGLIAFGALEEVGATGRVIFSDISQDLLEECQALARNGGTLGRCLFRSPRLLWKLSCSAYTNPRSGAGYGTNRRRAVSLHGSTTVAEPTRRHSTEPLLVIGRSGRRPIASRRGCMRPRYAFSLIAPMPKSTPVDRRARVQRRKVKSTASGPESARQPTWIEPQLTRLADEAPKGTDWLHEIKYDGYRMHARIDGDKIQLVTRTGLDWSHRYKRTIEALRSLRVPHVCIYVRHRSADK